MPRKPKKPCAYPGCPNLTEGRYCEQHERLRNKEYNQYQRPYNPSERYGSQWRQIRNRYIAAHPLCEECYRQGRLTTSQEVHHIVPLSKGGTHDFDNLMALCKQCHSRITAESGDRWHNK
jgi:5-methylcytosine-specific restriction protein A